MNHEYENENDAPDFEGGDPLNALPMEVLLALAPPDVLECVVSEGVKVVQDMAGKFGQIAAAAGHATFRAGVGYTKGEEKIRAVAGYLTIAVDANHIEEAGLTIEEAEEAIRGTFTALNEWFNNLNAQ